MAHTYSDTENIRTLRSGLSYSADPYSSTDHMQDTLSVIREMLGTEPHKSPFESNMLNCANLLIAQMREIKTYQQQQDMRINNMVIDMQEIKRSSVQIEQYSRRDCLTVTGLTKPDNETSTELGPKITAALSKSGISVKIDDLSAFHRNQQRNKTITQRYGTTRKIPPSVTVKFKSINQKDNVVKSYRNFDFAAKKPTEVQVYHSISSHYANLRQKLWNTINPLKQEERLSNGSDI